MKRSAIYLFLLLGTAISLPFTACDEDDDKSEPAATNNGGGTTNTACNGADGFCMNYGGVEKSGDAQLTVQAGINKTRIFWSAGTGNAYEQAELDFFALDTGRFPIQIPNVANTSSMEYFASASGAVSPAYGYVHVTKYDTVAGVSGTFEITMVDSTKVTGGLFTNIRKP